jgi:hypothetical protein
MPQDSIVTGSLQPFNIYIYFRAWPIRAQHVSTIWTASSQGVSVTSDLQHNLLSLQRTPDDLWPSAGSLEPPTDLHHGDLRQVVAFRQIWASSLGKNAPSCKMRGGGVEDHDFREGPGVRGCASHVPTACMWCYTIGNSQKLLSTSAPRK